jgi:RND superfamily putative drug exporter
MTGDANRRSHSAPKEPWERTGDPGEALVGGLAQSGRVALAAADVMVALLFTFALVRFG